MKSIGKIRDAIARLKKDDRLKGEPAQVQINAPLAFVQVELGVTIGALEWVLGERETWWGHDVE